LRKARLVREESKENYAQVTRNRSYKGCLGWKSTLPDLALPQDMTFHVQDLRRGERAITLIAPSNVNDQLVGASLRDGYTAK